MSDEPEAYASALMIEEQKAQSDRLAVMRQVVRSLIDSEDEKKYGLRWDEIAILPGLGGSNAKKAIYDLLTLKYVVVTTVSGVEETSGYVQINKLSELYGTTFFGRKWFLEEENG